MVGTDAPRESNANASERSANHWFLLPASKRMEQVDFGMPEDVFSWTTDQQKIFNTIQRYKTAAQRAFDKAFRAVET